MRMLAKNAFFEAYKIGHNVVQIKGRGGEQCYLLESADKAILIDGLVGVGSLKEFVSELTDKPVELVLTHGHLDHTGAAWEYKRCWIHPDDIPLMYAKQHSDMQKRLDFAKQSSPLAVMPCGNLSLDDVIPPGPVVTYPLYNGDVIRFGDEELEVIGVPGHTFGTLVFLYRKERMLFSGDACNINTLLGLSGSTSIEQYLKSLHHLRTFSDAYDLMYGGHGPGGVDKRIVDDAIAMCERILQRTDEKVPAVSFEGRAVFYGSSRNPDYTPVCGGLANIQYSEKELFEDQVRKYQPEDGIVF